MVMGVRLSRTTSMSAPRLVALPLAWLAYGALGLGNGFGWLSLAAAGWAAGLAGGVGLVRALGWPGRARFDAASVRFIVPGSWWPLALMLGLFAAKFALGLGQATHQAWTQPSSLPIAALHLALGLCGGALLGRSINVLRQRPSARLATV